jgi:PAS domain S-box-containing protein
MKSATPKTRNVSLDLQVALPGSVPALERRKTFQRRAEDHVRGTLAKSSAGGRLRAAELLLDKQQRLSEALHMANIGSWWQDRNGRPVWSDEMYRILGLAPHDFTPSADTLELLLHPDDRKVVHAQIDAALAGATAPEIEFRLLRPDGVQRWILARTQGTPHPGGGVERITGTYQDITERRLAEIAVVDAAASYHRLFDANPFPMWIYDPASLRFLAVNDAALGIYGYARAEFLGLTLNDLRPAEPFPSLDEISRSMGQPEPDALWRHQLKDGRLIDMEIIAQTIDFQGQSARVVLAHDVTARRRVAKEILESREALRALVQHQQSAQEEERVRISRHVHDELGQLLAALRFDLYWVERGLSAPEVPLSMHPVLDHSVAASALVVQAIAVVQALAAELRPTVLDHIGLSAALTQRAQQFERSTGVACSLAVEESFVSLPPGVANELFYICQEALTNVSRHAHATCVHLRLTEREGTVRLEVEDDGVGMDAGAATAAGSLGLLGMRERALHCGGTVRLEAASPHGTVVIAELPLANKPA